MHLNKDINNFPKADFPTNLYSIIIFSSAKLLHYLLASDKGTKNLKSK